MAKKRSKKRRVRRKSRARKSRARKSRKSSRRSRSRRRNPGNFVKPTPTVAQKHLDAWEKKGVTSKNQITTGMKAPQVGELKDDKDVKLAKIRYQEAQNTVNWYLDHFTRGGAKWQGDVHDAYKMAHQEWKEAKAKGTKLPAPIPPSKPASRSRGGNFKKVSKKHAIAYLKRQFRWPAKTVKDQLEAGKMRAYAALNSVGKWVTKKGGDIGARLAEAVTIVGEAAALFRQAQKNAAEYAAKEAAKKAKRDAINKKRWQKQVDELKKELQKVQKKLKGVQGVAARAKARAKRSRKRSRRRNPARRRNPRRRRNSSCSSRKKGTMRRRKKSRKARKARKAKKARKSRRKSRRSRRRRRR